MMQLLPAVDAQLSSTFSSGFALYNTVPIFTTSTLILVREETMLSNERCTNSEERTEQYNTNTTNQQDHEHIAASSNALK